MKRAFVQMGMLALAGLVGAGCSMNWVNVKDSSELPGTVKVWLVHRDDDNFRFGVANQSQKPITILLDSIKLSSPRNSISREPMHGGVAWGWTGAIVEGAVMGNSPVVPPGQTVSLDAHFDVDDAKIEKGDTVRLDFSNAVIQDGHPLAVTPLEFHIQ